MASDTSSALPVADDATDDAIVAPVRPARPALSPSDLTQTDRLWLFWERNKRTLAIALGALVLLAVGAALFAWWRAGQSDEAQERLAESVALYETGQFEQALKTEGTRIGLKDIADRYGSTDAGNLARYYAASAYYETKNYAEAGRYFDAFDGDGTLLGPAAEAGRAAVLENQNKPAEAAAAYVRAADAAKSELFTPMYLLSAARAHLAAGQPAEARTVLDRIQADHAQSPEAQELEFYYGMADAKAPAAN